MTDLKSSMVELELSPPVPPKSTNRTEANQKGKIHVKFTTLEDPEQAAEAELEKVRADEKAIGGGKRFGVPVELFTILYSGTCFFLLIVSFVATQNVQSMVNADLGSSVLGVLYGAYSIGTIVAVPIVERIGEKNCFIIAVLGYVFFITTAIKIVVELFYIASIVMGFGASLLWVSQGMYLNRVSSDARRSSNASYMVAFFATGHLFANFFTYLLQFNPGFSFTLFFSICSGVSIVSFLMFIFVPPAPPFEHKQPILEFGKSFLSFLINKNAMLLFPSFMAYGFNLSYCFGAFPSRAAEITQSTKISPLSLTFFGLVHMIVSLFGSKVAHLLGGNFLITLTTLGMVGGICASTFATKDTSYLFLITGALMGTLESGFLVQMFPILGRDFADRLGAANSVMRLISGVTLSSLFFIAIHLSYENVGILVGVVNVVALIALYVRSYLMSKGLSKPS